MPQGNIAIVEDEHAIARLLQINLEALDYRVTPFGNGEDFLAALNNTCLLYTSCSKCLSPTGVGRSTSHFRKNNCL